MKGLTKYTPSIPLSEFIDYLYSGPAILEEYDHPTHPHLTLKTEIFTKTNTKGQIKGIHTRPLNKTFTGMAGAIGIRFKPYGLYTGFGIPGNISVNHIIPGSRILNTSIENQIMDIIREGTAMDLVEYIHEALYDQLRPNPVLYEVTDMIDALVKADLTNNSQRYLAEAFERTPKSFIALFKKAMGITPLHYLHIHKVEQAKELITQQPGISLTNIAYALGFYDQAHFIRIFKNHTGLTPSRFRNKLEKQEG